MSVHTTALAVLTGAVIAGAYGFVIYLRRRKQGEDFRPVPLAATVIVGAVWGGVMAVSGEPVTYDRVQAALVTYVGLVAGTEALVKWALEELGWRTR